MTTLKSTQEDGIFVSNTKEQEFGDSNWTSYTPSYLGRGPVFTIASDSTNTELVVRSGLIPVTGEPVIAKDGSSTSIVKGNLGNVVENVDPYALGSAEYDNVSIVTSSATGDSNNGNFVFNDTGSKLYLLELNTSGVYQFTLSTEFDISTAVYDNVSFNLTTQDAGGRDIYLSNDGTKFFMFGTITDSVHQYTLSTPFDLSTISYDNISFSPTNQDSFPWNFTFNDTGSKMYISGNSTDSIHQYTLTTPFDISTASYDNVSFNFGNETINVGSFVFDNTGTKLFLLDASVNEILQYSLTTAYDISTTAYDQIFLDVTAQDDYTRGIQFNNAGTKLYTSGTRNASIYQYSSGAFVYYVDISALGLTNPPSVICQDDLPRMFTSYELIPGRCIANDTDLSYVSSTTTEYRTDVTDVVSFLRSGDNIIPFDGVLAADISDTAYELKTFITQDQQETGFDFNSDGTKMYAANGTINSVEQYTLTTPNDISTAVLDTGVSLDITPQDISIGRIEISSDGSKLLVLATGTGVPVIYQYTLSTPFDLGTATYDSVSFNNSTEDGNTTSFVYSYDGTKFFTVGPSQDLVFQYTLSTAFDLSSATYDNKSFSVNSEAFTPKSVSFNRRGSKMYIGNNFSVIYQYSLSTPYDVSTANYDQNSLDVKSQLGTAIVYLEGIAFSGDGTKMYMRNSTASPITFFQFAIDGTINGTELTPGPEIPLTADSLISASGPKTVGLEYNDIRYSTRGQDGLPRCVELKPDGTKMYVVGGNRNSILQYTLTTPNDITTADWDQISVNIGTEDSIPNGISLNNDGTKLYLVGESTDSVHQYSMSTAYDISTISYDGVNFSVVSEVYPEDLTFNTDGTKMYIVGEDTVATGVYRAFEYVLSTGFDISTASYNSVSFSSSLSAPMFTGILFNTSGSKLFLVDRSTDIIYQFSVVAPFDLSSTNATGPGTLDVTGQTTSLTSAAISGDGLTLFALESNAGANADSIFQYSMSSAFSLVSSSYDNASLKIGGEGRPLDLVFDDTGLKMYVAATENDPEFPSTTLFRYSLSVAYDLNSTITYDNVSVPIGFNANGKIRFNDNGTKLFVMGSDILYQYSLSAPYDITTLNFDGSYNFGYQGEGGVGMISFTFNEAGSKLYAMSESSYPGLRQFSVPVPFDITTGTGTKGVSYVVGVASGVTYYGVAFNNDGTKLYSVGVNPTYLKQNTLTTPFDLSTASSDGVWIDISTEMSTPKDLEFNDDGTLLFVVDSNSSTVYQYGLSVAFDLSTAVYSNVLFNATTQVSSAYSLRFNNDGSKMYILNNVDDTIYQYSLTTPYAIALASYDTINFSVSSQEGNPYGFTFNDDGTRFVVVGTFGDRTYSYNLSTAFDLSTATYNFANFFIGNQASQPTSIRFSNDGTIMFVLNQGDETLYRYLLSTPFDVTSALYDDFVPDVQYDNVQYNQTSENSSMEDLQFADNGRILYLVGNNTQTGVYKYNLSVPYLLSTITYSGDVFVTRTEDQVAKGFTFDAEKTKIYIAGIENNYIYEYNLVKNDVYVLEFNALAYSPVKVAIPDRSVECNSPTEEEWVNDYIRVGCSTVQDDGRGIRYKFIMNTDSEVFEARYDLTKTAPGIRDTRLLN